MFSVFCREPLAALGLRLGLFELQHYLPTCYDFCHSICPNVFSAYIQNVIIYDLCPVNLETFFFLGETTLG